MNKEKLHKLKDLFYRDCFGLTNSKSREWLSSQVEVSDRVLRKMIEDLRYEFDMMICPDIQDSGYFLVDIQNENDYNMGMRFFKSQKKRALSILRNRRPFKQLFTREQLRFEYVQDKINDMLDRFLVWCNA